MRYFYSVLLVTLLGVSQIPKSYSQVFVTPEPKIIADSEERNHWIDLHKNTDLLKDPIVGTIDKKDNVGHLQRIGTQGTDFGDFNKIRIDELWGPGTRLNKDTYRYKLLGVRTREDFDTYKIDTKFEGNKLVAYRISSHQIPKPLWIDIKK